MEKQCRDHLDKVVRPWAEKLGLTEKLEAGLEYARTFSGGPEEDWATYIGVDGNIEPESRSFIFTVYKRVVKAPDDGDWLMRDGLRHYMTIGMIWFPQDNEWSFHS